MLEIHTAKQSLETGISAKRIPSRVDLQEDKTRSVLILGDLKPSKGLILLPKIRVQLSDVGAECVACGRVYSQLLEDLTTLDGPSHGDVRPSLLSENAKPRGLRLDRL